MPVSFRILKRVCSLPNFLQCIQLMTEPENKVTMMVTPSFVTYLSTAYLRAGLTSLTLLPETVITLMSGMPFKYHSPFYEEFNQKIGEMMSVGLTQHWFDRQINEKGVKKVEDSEETQVLSMDHLTIGFQICLVPLCLSVFVFFVELLTPVVKPKLQTFLSVEVMSFFHKRR